MIEHMNGGPNNEAHAMVIKHIKILTKGKESADNLVSGHLQNDIEHQSKANKNLDDFKLRLFFRVPCKP